MWRVLRELRNKWSVAINFLMRGKEVPRKLGVSSTPEQSRGILVSTPNSTIIGKVLNKRVALAVEKTSKPWQTGCRPGFGTELPSLVSMEFLAMRTSLKPICWRLSPLGRRRISVSI